MKAPAEFYALSLTALGKSICVETIGTKWAGKSEYPNEIRVATPYDDTDLWKSFRECWVRVESRDALFAFLVSGGHGLISTEIITDWWPEFLAPTECFRYSERMPFIGSEHLPPGAEERYPPPLIRKRVLARDDYRCQVCGYSPQDHPAIKLEIHHIVEQAIGGLSIESNLLTLCRNCHDNAMPPDAWLRHDMFEKVFIAASRFHRRNHEQGVADYRSLVARARGNEVATDLEEPLEYLTVDDLNETRRHGKWYMAYLMLVTNSVIRYLTLSDWRRIMPKELRRAIGNTNLVEALGSTAQPDAQPDGSRRR